MNAQHDDVARVIENAAPPPPAEWLQVIVARGNTARKLARAADREISERATITIRGVGGYIPDISGLDWSAGSGPLLDTDDKTLSDLSALVRLMVRRSLLVTPDVLREEFEEWMAEHD